MTKHVLKTSVVPALLMVALCCFALLPMFADARGKPESTGQDRVASVSNKAKDTSSAQEESEEEGEEEGGEGDEGSPTKPRGLERAASAGKKPDEIRAQLQYIHLLIAQMKEAKAGGGIGRELSAFIANGRQLPETGGDNPGVASIFVASLSGSSFSIEENDASTTEDNVITYTLELDVTATGTDLVIPDEIDTTSTSTVGIVYSITNASGTIVTTGVAEASLSSTVAASSSEYAIEDGDTQTFTITVDYDPTDGEEYRVQLEEIQVNGEFYEFAPEVDFQSALVSETSSV